MGPGSFAPPSLSMGLTAQMDVPSWRSQTKCSTSTWLGCEYSLMIPALTTTQRSSQEGYEESICLWSLHTLLFFFGELSWFCRSIAPVFNFICTTRSWKTVLKFDWLGVILRQSFEQFICVLVLLHSLFLHIVQNERYHTEQAWSMNYIVTKL